ncbi:MAG: hypothetical protein HXY18_14605 [Bryobacteraceae bacterium]|nr:hypothetical protein [Bryobacteraceae bacterium]
MKSVAIIGAGGKMGARAVDKLSAANRWRLLLCESDPSKAAALATTPLDEAMQSADHVVMAVPDALIGRISRDLVPRMKQGGTLIMLDAAAAYVGQLASRPGVTQMIAHPCHPPFFTVQPTPEAQADYFGGVAAQDIIVSLIEGDEACFTEGIEVCKDMFGPVNRALRVTPEQFAFLEPAMSEILVAAAACWMKDALEETVARGVPRDAAEAFIAGHAQIAMAIAFGAEKAPFSDAAKLAVQWGTQQYISPAWRKAFDREVLEEAIAFMLGPASS